MLAPPPRFSQLATSFIAWLRLGIPRALLPRLVCPCLQQQRRPHPEIKTSDSQIVEITPKTLSFSAPNTQIFNQQIRTPHSFGGEPSIIACDPRAVNRLRRPISAGLARPAW